MTTINPGGDDRSTTRREVLGSLGASALTVPTVFGGAAGGTDSVAVRVRTYADGRTGWTDRPRASHRAVERGIASVTGAAERLLDRRVESDVARGPPVPREALSYGSEAALLDSLRDWIADGDAREGPVCHLFLADAPLNVDLGYGGADAGVAGNAFGAQAIANVGATDRYDGPGVSANMAIHEALHTFVRPADAAAVNGSRCEHDLGAVARLRPGHLVVTPLATSYAAPGSGTETAFHGSGCYGHADFSRYDRTLDADRVRWYHTTTPSPATKAAVARYVSRSL